MGQDPQALFAVNAVGAAVAERQRGQELRAALSVQRQLCPDEGGGQRRAETGEKERGKREQTKTKPAPKWGGGGEEEEEEEGLGGWGGMRPRWGLKKGERPIAGLWRGCGPIEVKGTRRPHWRGCGPIGG